MTVINKAKRRFCEQYALANEFRIPNPERACLPASTPNPELPQKLFFHECKPIFSEFETTPGIDTPPSYQPRQLAPSPPPVHNSPIANTGTMHGSLTIDTRELLADIRQIVEAGVAQGLANHGATSQGQAKAEDKDEIEDLLGSLDMSFMLDEEE